MIGINKIGDFNLVYDGEPLSDHFIIKNVELPLLPTIDAVTLTMDGRPGSWFVSRKIGTRSIIVHAALMNDNRSRIDMMEKWIRQSTILAKDYDSKLELGNGYFVYAMLVGETPIKRDKNGRWSEVELNFMCYDPYIYGENHNIDLVTGYRNDFMIEGTQPTWPLISLVDFTKSGYVTITKESDFKKSKIVVSQGNTNYIYVNSEDHICVDRNQRFLPLSPETRFFQLDPGYNVISISDGVGSINYRERYL